MCSYCRFPSQPDPQVALSSRPQPDLASTRPYRRVGPAPDRRPGERVGSGSRRGRNANVLVGDEVVAAVGGHVAAWAGCRLVGTGAGAGVGLSEGPGRDFFISYTGVNEAWARWIAVELERAGYTTVSQVLDMRPGHDFVHAMQQATTTAARTIAVLSPAYVKSTFGVRMAGGVRRGSDG